MVTVSFLARKFWTTLPVSRIKRLSWDMNESFRPCSFWLDCCLTDRLFDLGNQMVFSSTIQKPGFLHLSPTFGSQWQLVSWSGLLIAWVLIGFLTEVQDKLLVTSYDWRFRDLVMINGHWVQGNHNPNNQNAIRVPRASFIFPMWYQGIQI